MFLCIIMSADTVFTNGSITNITYYFGAILFKMFFIPNSPFFIKLTEILFIIIVVLLIIF